MTTTFANGYALLIGVNEHQVPAWALPAVAKDIAALHAVLIHPQRCAYPAEQVRLLIGSDATRSAILAGLDWLQAQLAADPSGNATAVVYYSGHGWRSEAATPTYYLIPYDTQRQGNSPKRATALRGEEFAEAVAGLTPQRLLVVLDCCHAAGIDAKALGTYVPAALPVDLLLTNDAAKGPAATGDDAKALESLAVGHGRAILSSSQGSERSYIRPDKTMSIFTYHLIEALTGHAQPQSGASEVLVTDLLSHVHRRVPVSAQQQGYAQHPDYKLTGNFPLALLLGGKGLTAGQPAPDPLQPIATGPATSQVSNTGSGAIAQEHSVAAGERGVAIGGSVSNSPIITGNNNRIDQSSRIFDQRGQKVRGNQTNVTGNINTGGGLFNVGDIHTGGADFVGRDKITTGNISGTGIAIGRGAQANVNQGSSAAEIAKLFAPILALAQSAPAEQRSTALQTAAALQQEAAKGKQEDDSVMADLVDKLVGLVPSAVSAVVSAFASPILAGVVGPATKYVLRKLGVK